MTIFDHYENHYHYQIKNDFFFVGNDYGRNHDFIFIFIFTDSFHLIRITYELYNTCKKNNEYF